jgi:predicted dehydrogenase
MDCIKTVFSAFGMSGKVFHGPLLLADSRFQWAGVVQRSKRDAAEFQPDVLIFKTLAECIEKVGPELVVVNTPPHVHEQEIRLALEAGCHVVVEKPMVTSLSQATQLLDLAEKKGKMLTTFQNRRWDSDFLTLKKILKDGVLGNVFHAEIHFDRFRPIVETNTWKEEENPGSGLVWNLGPHLLDQATQLFGFPKGITAILKKHRQAAQVEDYFHLLLHYPTAEVELKSSYLVPFHLPKYKIQGDTFSFEKNGIDIQEAQLKAGMKPNEDTFGREPENQNGFLVKINGQNLEKQEIPNEKGNYTAYYDLVFKAIRQGGKPPVSKQEMLWVMRLILAAYRSNKEGKTIWF